LKYIYIYISRFKFFFKETQKLPLGRWKIEYGNSELIKQTLANHDNCGTCGTLESIAYEKIVKIPYKKIVTKKY